MFINLRSRMGDLAIRAAGLGLLATGTVSIRALYHLVHGVPLHPATAGEFMLAMVGFLAWSFGAPLLALGRHIFDEIEISPRWATRLNRTEVSRLRDLSLGTGESARRGESGMAGSFVTLIYIGFLILAARLILRSERPPPVLPHCDPTIGLRDPVRPTGPRD